MGFSVSGQVSTSSIMAEIALALQGEGGNEAEGVMAPQEGCDLEKPPEFAQRGLLSGEAKPYLFMRSETPSFSQKLTSYLSDVNRPQEKKTLDFKESTHHLGFKESTVREKELKVLEPAQSKLDEKSQEQKETFQKAHTSAQRQFEKPSVSKQPQSPLREANILGRHYPQGAANAHRSTQQNLAPRKETSPSPHDSKRKESESRTSTRDEGSSSLPRLYAKEEREIMRETREENEGFVEKERERDQQRRDGGDDGSGDNVEKIDEAFAKELTSYAAEESILSQIFNMRVSQFDVLVLFIEILKLEIRGREQERLSRRQEREYQLLYMQKVVDNYKSQGKWTFMSSLGAGLLAIVSGACPIIGHTAAGTWIQQKLGSVFTSMQDMKKDQLFKGVTKITYAMSEMYKSTGQIHNTFAEGNRTFDQHMSDMYRSDWDESTRTMEEIKDSWKGIENFLHQTLQMEHDTIRQLYSH